MERKKALRIATIALIIATLAMFSISIYNIIAFVSGAVYPGPSLGLKQIPSGDYLLSLSLNSTNRGFLDVDLSTKMIVFDTNGVLVGTNSTSIHIPAGQSGSAYVSLIVPSALASGGNPQNMKGSMQMELELRVLWKLVGVKEVVRSGSGTQ